MTTSEQYTTATFSIEEDRCERMVQLVLSQARADEAIRILDIGCGTGGQILRLAPELPLATFVGLDISPKSIEEANRRAEDSPHRGRIEYLAMPYLDVPLGLFDIIISDTVLHLIEGSDEELASKLAKELMPDGKLIYTMPYRCFFNQLLLVFRRLSRRLRTPSLDALFLTVSGAIYGKRYSRAFLQERIAYMYLLPHRYHDSMVRALAKNDLTLLNETVVSNESIAKLIHKSALYVKLPRAST